MKFDKNKRMGVMIKILSDHPGRIYTLKFFSELFGTAKSTVSDDIDEMAEVFENLGLGCLETIAGASGGVRLRPRLFHGDLVSFLLDLCDRMSSPERVLPGGFLYRADLLYMPEIAQKIGEILAFEFEHTKPDFVITVETKGIPVAMMTARALDCPLVIARRNNEVTEGSSVSINYVSASSNRLQTMSLARRAVKQGQTGLIIDDFMRGGGTARGMVELLSEFNINIAGVGVVITTSVPSEKMVKEYKALIELKEASGNAESSRFSPARWVSERSII